ncbi:MAG: hypothetical protein JJU06_06710 [Ectothiorhodospiraceae bacterium]|nr:hypothetical protein [Ectothiorhodospiraceae bacterium]MCH8504717.1 hypothetical protein [Ectothiorhodospiraceae bacterium]
MDQRTLDELRASLQRFVDWRRETGRALSEPGAERLAVQAVASALAARLVSGLPAGRREALATGFSQIVQELVSELSFNPSAHGGDA